MIEISTIIVSKNIPWGKICQLSIHPTLSSVLGFSPDHVLFQTLIFLSNTVLQMFTPENNANTPLILELLPTFSPLRIFRKISLDLSIRAVKILRQKNVRALRPKRVNDFFCLFFPHTEKFTQMKEAVIIRLTQHSSHLNRENQSKCLAKHPSLYVLDKVH